MNIHLTTDRLVLREFTLADFSDVLALDTDPEVMRYISDGLPRTAEEVRAFLDMCISGYAEGTGLGFWAAMDLTTQEFLGWFHFRPDRALANAIEVGYRLMRSTRGRGLATEGAKALIENGFENQGVSLVTGRTMKGNTASANVLQKCGLTFVSEYQEIRWSGKDKTALLFQRSLGGNGL